MDYEKNKIKSSLRRHRDEVAVKKQTKITKQRGMFTDEHKVVKEPHRLHKRHAMDCGNPQCGLCGNPRHIHKDNLTAQEKRLFQDIDTPNDRHSNGLKNDQEDLL